MRKVALNWDDLRFILALRRAGSLGAAARMLKVESSTASRRLASLEAALGAQLAVRTPEGLHLSDAGELAGEVAEHIESQLKALEKRIGGEDDKAEGLVRLSTTDSMATFLMRGLTPLREEHPKIVVELVLSSAAMDLVRRQADIAIRLFRDDSPTLVARKIGDIGWSLYAGSSYIERTGIALDEPLSDEALHGHDVVGFQGAAGRSSGARWLAAHCRAEDVVLSAGGVQSVMTAVKAGLGISALPCFVAAEEPGLKRLTDAIVATVEAFVVIPPDHRRTARVRTVMDAVIALFERERVLLAGGAA
jgi:DNA-binding transcriptional LysR family regulator